MSTRIMLRIPGREDVVLDLRPGFMHPVSLRAGIHGEIGHFSVLLTPRHPRAGAGRACHRAARAGCAMTRDPAPHAFAADPDLPPDHNGRRVCRCGLVGEPDDARHQLPDVPEQAEQRLPYRDE